MLQKEVERFGRPFRRGQETCAEHRFIRNGGEPSEFLETTNAELESLVVHHT